MSDITSGELAAPLPPAAEIQARLRDFLSRKAFLLPGRLEALISAVSPDRLRASLRGMVDLLRRERPARSTGDADWLLLVERIRDHGRRGTIEGYGEYLFPIGFKA